MDVVGFSAFNFGACVTSGGGWETYEEVIEPYMERMEAMALGKLPFQSLPNPIDHISLHSLWCKGKGSESQIVLLIGLLL